MNDMKKLLLILLMSSTSLLYAQDYTTSLGVRIGGWENGVTLKHMLGDGGALEAILSSRYRGYNIAGLYEIQNEIPDVDGLYWYVGGGAHVGQYNSRYYTVYNTTTNRNYTVIGIDGILGVEYVFEDYPFNVSLDWKPVFNLINAGNYPFWGDSGALSVRYIF